MSLYSQKLLDPRWQKKRLGILERDKWSCQICEDKEKTLHVHHIFYDGFNDPWDCLNESLITLCFECHENEQEQYKNSITELKKAMCMAGIFTSDQVDYLVSIIRENFINGVFHAKN
jgi:hypothetical protein